MSDTNAASDVPQPAVAPSAGAMLRRARQAQGLHIAALAAAIKVVPRKLELLENDQYDKLTDATFVRALAQTVCRTLKIDAAPVLALLPPASGNRLDQVDHGLNTPFRERPGRLVPAEWSSLTNPAVWLAGVLVLGALAVYLFPAGWLPASSPSAKLTASGAVAPPASAPVAVDAAAAAAASAVPADPASAPAVAAAGTPAAEPAASAAPGADGSAAPGNPDFPPVTAETADDAPPPGAELLQLHASAQSWIEVTDAHGQSLLSRLIEPGESVGVDGAPPLKLKIGNARATEVVYRGRPVELAASTKDNVARLELK